MKITQLFKNQTNSDSTEKQFVVLDTETTGLFKNDRIVEIGAIVIHGNEILEEWSTLINPNRDLGPIHIHGITPTMVSMAPSFAEIANDLARLLNGRTLVCHNAHFDIRMLSQEFNRLGIQVSLGKPFCTMVAAKRQLGGGFSLADTCDALDIQISEAHSALGDSRMARQVFMELSQDEQETSLAEILYNKEAMPSRTIQRSAFAENKHDASSRIKEFTKKVPFPTSDNAEIAYLLLLNMALEDLQISAEEKGELSTWALNLGLTLEKISELHINYLDSCIEAAKRDKFVSEDEVAIIDKIAFALGLDSPNVDFTQNLITNDSQFTVGKRICFTGMALTEEGEQIPRVHLEALAAKSGLQPVNAVTKKGCDILVAADAASMSGKAKKAREWGIEVVTISQFFTFLDGRN
jgi:DNA polymerase-3 subunit epsilon